MKLKKIITGLISVCMAGMSIPAIPVNAENSTYISDIKVVGCGSETDAKKILHIIIIRIVHRYARAI